MTSSSALNTYHVGQLMSVASLSARPTLANDVETLSRTLINIGVIILYPSQLRVQVKHVRHEDDPGCCFVGRSFF